MISNLNALEWSAANPLRRRNYLAVANGSTFEMAKQVHQRIDLVAVERAVNADYPLPKLTYREKVRAARILWEAEAGPTEIAQRVGVSVRTAQRWADTWRAEAAV